jgi:hypothetical protein
MLDSGLLALKKVASICKLQDAHKSFAVSELSRIGISILVGECSIIKLTIIPSTVEFLVVTCFEISHLAIAMRHIIFTFAKTLISTIYSIDVLGLGKLFLKIRVWNKFWLEYKQIGYVFSYH